MQTTDIIRSQLLRCKVPMVKQTFPVERWLMLKATKKDRFWRIGNRIVSRNLAVAAIRCGIATFTEN